MLLLVDLDNTLVDRASAFDQWAKEFVRRLGCPPGDADWLIGADRDGYASRLFLAGQMKIKFGLNHDFEALVQILLFEHVDLMTMDAQNLRALKEAREAGWLIGIVTNGTTAQQTRKIDRLGLNNYTDAIVISEEAGVSKPEREIFEIAAHRLHGEPGNGWMVGDHPIADIEGGRKAGLSTGWVSRGRAWPDAEATPILTGLTTAEVIDAVVRREPR
ncbi:HAD family hydrolase [Paenarthrobacter sp. NPDC089989]|uniref:HAD family hydrolase n=1 Tax=unclassified Paenarthrobacter TaxID=2634190 RepID=UPI00380CA9F5